MNINNHLYINLIELKKIIQTLHTLTGLTIGVLTSDGDVLCEYPTQLTSFCQKVRDSHGKDKCLDCDKAGVHRCKETAAPYSYICHAGLYETVFPIFYDQKIYLYIVLGQYINTDKKEIQDQAFASYCQKQNIKEDFLIEDYNKTTKLSNEHLSAIISITQLCIPSLWERKILAAQKEPLFQEIEEYIKQNIAEPLTIQSICKRFFVSKEILYSLFQEYYGLTIKKYITQKRIALAKDLLINTKLSITEICDKVGQSNYNAFIKTFKSYEKISPSKYRKKFSVSAPTDSIKDSLPS